MNLNLNLNAACNQEPDQQMRPASSAVPALQGDPAWRDCQPMTAHDVDDMLALEQSVYPMPWSRGNFVDTLDCAYPAWVLRDADGLLLAYFLLMPMVDEVHLLNLAVRADRQGHGLGRYMLGKALACARAMGMASMLLEVRPSNAAALALYGRDGFLQVGRRKGYYPAPEQQREDAIVMRRAP
jgi:ribosomal-protein-alanine N-acetyltransferase